MDKNDIKIHEENGDVVFDTPSGPFKFPFGRETINDTRLTIILGFIERCSVQLEQTARVREESAKAIGLAKEDTAKSIGLAKEKTKQDGVDALKAFSMKFTECMTSAFGDEAEIPSNDLGMSEEEFNQTDFGNPEAEQH